MLSADEVERLDEPGFKWLQKRGIGGKRKDVQFYESFTYDGLDYTLYDCVYMYKEGEPEPYIGKLIKIWENADKSKKIKVQWFFRPSEISYYLKDADVLENELFFASGEGIGLANLNPLEAIAGKCNVVCISADSRNPQPSAKELQMADYVFYRTFDVKSYTISDQIGDTIGGLEVKFLFNKSKSISSLDISKHDSSIKDEMRIAICKEATKISGKCLPQEFNNVKPNERDDHILVESPNVKEAQVKQEPLTVSQVQVEERVKPARKSTTVDDTLSKRMKFDGVDPSLRAEDTNSAYPDVVSGATLFDARLKSELIKCSEGFGKDVKLCEDASSLEEKLSKETSRFGHGTDVAGLGSGAKLTKQMSILAEKLPKSNTILCKEKSKLAQLKDFGIEEHENRGGNQSVCGEMSLAGNVVSPSETMSPLLTKVSPRETSRSGSNTDFEGSTKVSPRETSRSGSSTDFEGCRHVEKLVKGLSATKKRQLGTNDDLSKEKRKLGVDACRVAKDRSLTKDSCPTEEVPRKKLKFNDSIRTMKYNEDNAIKKLKEKTCVSEMKSLSKHVTPYDKERSKVAKGLSEEWHDEKLHKISNDKFPSIILEGDGGKVGYGTFEVTRRPIVEKSNWIKLPWEERMKDANNHGRLVLLQNLDPEYTSADVEDIIWCAFKEYCTAKMVQHTAISTPDSGQAFVIFKTRDAADKVFRKLNDECLMLPNQRPLVACAGYFPKFEKQMNFVGHLTLDKARRQIQREAKEAVSTSHYSQSNTIEHEMALDWCLLQSKSDKWWERLYEQQRKEVKKLKDELKSKSK